jgi:hypothetical protein
MKQSEHGFIGFLLHVSSAMQARVLLNSMFCEVPVTPGRLDFPYWFYGITHRLNNRAISSRRAYTTCAQSHPVSDKGGLIRVVRANSIPCAFLFRNYVQGSLQFQVENPNIVFLASSKTPERSKISTVYRCLFILQGGGVAFNFSNTFDHAFC